MATFSTKKQKIRFMWNRLEATKQNYLNQLRIDSETQTKIEQSLRDLSTDKIFIDFSSEWETIEGTINYQLIFDRLNINFIPFIRTAICYGFGNPANNSFSTTELGNLVINFVDNAEINEIIQLIDIPNEPNSSLFKKVIINKSYSVGVTSETLGTALQVKLQAEFYNPQEFV